MVCSGELRIRTKVQAPEDPVAHEQCNRQEDGQELAPGRQQSARLPKVRARHQSHSIKDSTSTYRPPQATLHNRTDRAASGSSVPSSLLVYLEAQHHPALQVVSDVAVRRPAPGAAHLHQQAEKGILRKPSFQHEVYSETLPHLSRQASHTACVYLKFAFVQHRPAGLAPPLENFDPFASPSIAMTTEAALH